MKRVLSAGGLLTERRITPDGGIERYTWLIASHKSARNPRATDQDWLERKAKLQPPKGTVKWYELPSDEESEYDLQPTAEREFYEETGILAVARALIEVHTREAWNHKTGKLVLKTIAIFEMERVQEELELVTKPDETPVCVRVDDSLLPRMTHPEDRALLASYYNLAVPLGIPAQRRESQLLDIASSEAKV